MKQYLEALQHIYVNGDSRGDRTGTGTIGVFGYQMRFDLSEGFPAVTTKKLAWKAMVSELLWMLEGSSNERRLAEILYGRRDDDCKTIWAANYENQAKALGYTGGDLGPVYGEQWRSWYGCTRDGDAIEVDQIHEVIRGLGADPYGRRHIVSAWNPTQLEEMALPPCHAFFQFYVSSDNKLSCQLYQRSCDMFLGVPFNIASYALLTHIIARECGMDVGEFVWAGGDCHIYNNHIDQVKEQLERSPMKLPYLNIKGEQSWDKHTMDSFELVDYNPMPSIKAEMAV